MNPLTEKERQIFDTGVDMGAFAAQQYVNRYNRHDSVIIPKWVQELPTELEMFIEKYIEGMKLVYNKELVEHGFFFGFMVTYMLMKKLQVRTLGALNNYVWLFNQLDVLGGQLI